MNKDQVKGKLKEVAGETHKRTGRAVGSADQAAKGHAREVAGKTQKKVGDLEEAAKDITKKP